MEVAVDNRTRVESTPFSQERKLGMWLFVISDSMTFGAFLCGYAYLRLAGPEWPRPFSLSSLALPLIMTVCLLTSGVTIRLSVSAIRNSNAQASRLLMFVTVALGAAFVLLHILEWSRLLGEGFSPSSLPAAWKSRWPHASPAFGSAFFVITGLHLLHVIMGVVYLSVVAIRIRGNDRERVETSAIYWQFVDMVWIFIFPLLYLLSIGSDV